MYDGGLAGLAGAEQSDELVGRLSQPVADGGDLGAVERLRSINLLY